MRVFKKVMSAFLASVMCIPTGILNLAYAAETDSGSYTVALAEPENGVMQFSESCMEASTATQDGYHIVRIGDDGTAEQVENDGSLWAFSKNDKVEVELIPDEGYEVDSLVLTDNETGRELAHEDTTDNVFSFTMPEKNITVSAEFAEVQADNGNSDDENSLAEDGADENNVITENEYGETVYERIGLEDDNAISLQERIDSLPDMDDLYYSLCMEDESIPEITDEINDISSIYFNQMDDNERAQINPAILFADKLILEAEISEISPESDWEPDSDEIEELQARIDALDSVYDIAEPEMTEDAVAFDYDGGNMYISNEKQDELFLEVLDLSKEIFFLKDEYRKQLDMRQLEDLYRFFRGGHVESMDNGIMAMSAEDDGIMALADASDPYMSGYYDRTSANNPYKSSFFAGVFSNDEGMIAYCGRAGVKAFSHAASAVDFTDGGHVEEIFKDTENPEGINNIARAILYYGYGGPGFDAGIMDGLLDPDYSDPLISQGLIPRSSAARQTNDERSESRADTPQLCCGEFHLMYLQSMRMQGLKE